MWWIAAELRRCNSACIRPVPDSFPVLYISFYVVHWDTLHVTTRAMCVACAFCSNPDKRMAHLCETWCSQASAKQRRGRAGRTREGVCYKLFSRQVHEDVMAPYQLPEIKRVPLEDLTLQILLKGSQPAAFLSKALDPPASDAIRAAVHNLHELGAIATTTNTSPGIGGTSSSSAAMLCELTPLGFHLAHIPVEPRVGKMLIFGCIFGVLPPLLTIAAAWCVCTLTLDLCTIFFQFSIWAIMAADRCRLVSTGQGSRLLTRRLGSRQTPIDPSENSLARHILTILQWWQRLTVGLVLAAVRSSLAQ